MTEPSSLCGPLLGPSSLTYTNEAVVQRYVIMVMAMAMDMVMAMVMTMAIAIVMAMDIGLWRDIPFYYLIACHILSYPGQVQRYNGN